MRARRSLFFHYFSGSRPYAYSLERPGFYYREYRRLMAHGRAILPEAMLDLDYTDVFRHKRYGTDRAPLTDEETRRVYRTKTRGEAVRKLISDDGHHLDRWEHLMTLPMKFKRRALLRPWPRHTSEIDFGDTIETGRLVQLLFFAAVAPNSAMAAPEL